MFFGFRSRRRARLRAQPFPAPWIETLRHALPYYAALPPDAQQRLLGDIQVFLAEKNFEGCGGLALTEDMRVTIAAHACLLTFNRSIDDYAALDTILVYPRPFFVDRASLLDDGHGPTGEVIVEEDDVLNGESWSKGIVVLAWNEIRQTLAGRTPGNNVMFHEFAHQLDPWNTPGDSPLSGPSPWPPIFEDEYNTLIGLVDRGKETFIDDYAATNRAEFFAVVTEHFIEIPHDLRDEHPALYDTLKAFYGLDPAALLPAS